MNGRSASSETWRSTSCAPRSRSDGPPVARAPGCRVARVRCVASPAGPQLVGPIQQPCPFGLIARWPLPPGWIARARSRQGQISDPRAIATVSLSCATAVSISPDPAPGGESGSGARLASRYLSGEGDLERLAVVRLRGGHLRRQRPTAPRPSRTSARSVSLPTSAAISSAASNQTSASSGPRRVQGRLAELDIRSGQVVRQSGFPAQLDREVQTSSASSVRPANLRPCPR